MTSHLDRLPHDIAEDWMTMDILQLLEDWKSNHHNGHHSGHHNGHHLYSYINHLLVTKMKGQINERPNNVTYMLAGSHGATAVSQPMKDLGKHGYGVQRSDSPTALLPIKPTLNCEFVPEILLARYPAAPPVWRIWNHQTPISTIRHPTRASAKEVTVWCQT